MKQEERILKIAKAINSIGDYRSTGFALAQIINFLLRKIKFESRPKFKNKIREKLLQLNFYEMSEKSSPPTAAIGQAITFVKTILNGQNPDYVKSVINQITKSL